LPSAPSRTAPPSDPDGDGVCDDVNGNGRPDFADVVLFFDRMDWIAANEPVTAFDCNGNGRIDFADVVGLFARL
jgi:PKD repeat protein